MKILGLMSGTSLDGVDMALCDMSDEGYSIVAAKTVPYDEKWRGRLANLENVSALEYAKANVELGRYYGQIINDFINDNELHVDAVASHGHTIFHQPAAGLTTQIGDGDAIAAETGLKVVSNFRTLDVALGGQGAPLVPIGDELLFSEFDACLNLGGIANISFKKDGRRVAFDICPCNMALNRLAGQLGFEYDNGGENARRGILNYYLNQSLNLLDYYRAEYPKSLGKEWFMKHFWPVVEASGLSTVDLLRTCTEHIAYQIAEVMKNNSIGTMLVTGGGAFNKYLIECLSANVPEVEITIPDDLIVNYKEAFIFALLGYLRLSNKVNTLCSVTGARVDSIGGTISGIVSV